MEEIAGLVTPGSTSKGSPSRSLRHFDKSNKEIVHSVAQLLDIRVLIGRALVAVNRDALIDDLSIEIALLCRAIP